MSENRGIEILNKDTPKGVSVIIGNTKVDTHGQPIDIQFGKQNACVYLVIDTSGSMAGRKLEQAKEGVIDFAKNASRKEYAVGLISFDSDAKHICKPTYDIGLLRDCVRKMRVSGTTNMAEAIKMAHNHLMQSAGTRVIVIATDGMPDNVQDTLREGMKTKKDKIDIITIGTDDADLSFLKQLATRAELGEKVAKEVFSQAITQASRLLPLPKSVVVKR